MEHKALFPVKGWDVSASKLKTQTISSSKGGGSSKKSKKRKRGKNKQGTSEDVTDQNVSDLYASLVEDSHLSFVSDAKDEADAESGNEEKPRKKKAKKEKHRDKQDAEARAADRDDEKSSLIIDDSVGIGETSEVKDGKRQGKKEKQNKKPKSGPLTNGAGNAESEGAEELAVYDAGIIDKKVTKLEKNVMNIAKGIKDLGDYHTRRQVSQDVEGEVQSFKNRSQDAFDSIGNAVTVGKEEANRKSDSVHTSLSRPGVIDDSAGNTSTIPSTNVPPSAVDEIDKGVVSLEELEPKTLSRKQAKKLAKKQEKDAAPQAMSANKLKIDEAANDQLESLIREHEAAMKRFKEDELERQKKLAQQKADHELQFNLQKAKLLNKQNTLKQDEEATKPLGPVNGGSLPSSHAGRVNGAIKSKDTSQLTKQESSAQATSTQPTPRAQSNGEVKTKTLSVNDQAPQSAKSSIAKTPIQQKMQEKLISSRFRIYNEQLYTTPSSTGASVFRSDPTGFETYHTGFRNQVSSWPVNPLDVFIRELKNRASARPFHHQKHKMGGRGPQQQSQNAAVAPLPRDQRTGLCRIADLGCGDANLATSMIEFDKKKKFKLGVSSFDLERPKGANAVLVTKADITNLAAAGIKNPGLEIVVCCLSLMPTNWVQIVDECARVLVLGGECWVAEVKSRFRRKDESVNAKTKIMSVGNGKKGFNNNSVKGKKRPREEDEAEPDWRDGLEEPAEKGDDTDVTAFVDVFRRRGLEPRGEVDKSNKMFVSMKFVKTGKKLAVDEADGNGTALYAKKGMEGKRRKLSATGPGKLDVDMQAIVEEGKVLKPCVYKTR